MFPDAPPARFVAVVALVADVAVAALPEIDPVMVELTVRPDRVPTAVMPVYDPEIRAESMVPEVIADAPIAIFVLVTLVSWPWALTANTGTAEAEP